MTAERTEATELDTLEEVGRMENAGVPREHAVAMLYAAIRASDARYHALDRKLDALDTRIDALSIKIDGVDAKFKGLETRIEGLETKVDGVDAKFKGLETKIDGVDAKLIGLRWQWAAIGLLVGAGGFGLAQSLPDVIAALR